jgi:hypothetical protein
MKTRQDSTKEIRLEIRGSRGKVSRVRILERKNGDKFHRIDGGWAEDHVTHLRLFAKVAATVAKSIAPPFDPEAILLTVNGSPPQDAPLAEEAGHARVSRRRTGRGRDLVSGRARAGMGRAPALCSSAGVTRPRHWPSGASREAQINGVGHPSNTEGL